MLEIGQGRGVLMYGSPDEAGASTFYVTTEDGDWTTRARARTPYPHGDAARRAIGALHLHNPEAAGPHRATGRDLPKARPRGGAAATASRPV